MRMTSKNLILHFYENQWYLIGFSLNLRLNDWFCEKYWCSIQCIKPAITLKLNTFLESYG